MMVLVSYDVSTVDEGGPGRLRRVAKTCKNYGQCVQYSVFECIVDTVKLSHVWDNDIYGNSITGPRFFQKWKYHNLCGLWILKSWKAIIRKVMIQTHTRCSILMNSTAP